MVDYHANIFASQTTVSVVRTAKCVGGSYHSPSVTNLDKYWNTPSFSDVVVQIVDARNPLLFYCGDLETYVSEVNLAKVSVLLINKADYLTKTQRFV